MSTGRYKFTHSNLEDYFLWYAKELSDAGYIKAMYWQQHSFVLLDPVIRKFSSDEVKVRKTSAGNRTKVIDLSSGKFEKENKNVKIIPKHSYTPEAIIVWKDNEAEGRSAKNVFFTDIDDETVVHNAKIPFVAQRYTIEELGIHNEYVSIIEVKPDFDFKNMSRLVKINKQFLYVVTGLVLNICYIPKLFIETFTPERYLLTDKTMKQRKINFTITKLNEYVTKIKL